MNLPFETHELGKSYLSGLVGFQEFFLARDDEPALPRLHVHETRLLSKRELDFVGIQNVENHDFVLAVNYARSEAIKNLLFDQYIRRHRQAEELLEHHESKTLEFKSTLRWNVEE